MGVGAESLMSALRVWLVPLIGVSVPQLSSEFSAQVTAEQCRALPVCGGATPGLEPSAASRDQIALGRSIHWGVRPGVHPPVAAPLGVWT
ncbi:MAG: hypothetical protein LBC97_11150 [Bifidobacteriaceae bacterium]|nr:hypothetical protein [Bifidobacteriaceae bacterium]